ncbi:MAG TPA: hypothetical protein DDW94_08120 [Deltaproteobacteria bacterium]|nr:MAG: hypothetical protein A2Z79_02645 [Deltaproteobacteria bacterium GWA2_55_82]OGQ62708.1 MAG: hypothetical protein A3I81_09465 [Deltaproteobacteria bacterium RIFCSPLOWO2_02_FULL_55_12]OIJ74301.1 MAG: hypothetical protein A2V21_308545 [Deltaproteobacteria bacterium GWC2_55_46]HBG46940.1 hypothetical protein [Deltaproteobacteria bacterium]HCY11002.1 hypothetical protein [Deltaproteobacteria bacterium]
MATRINFIDLYSFYNDLDASVIETLMEGRNITCSIRTLGKVRFATDMGAYLETRIAVEEGSIENARKIIRDAIRNGVISKEGKFRT